jgi:hypothetical protein
MGELDEVQQQPFSDAGSQQLFAADAAPAAGRSHWLPRQMQSSRGSPARSTATAVTEM